MSECAGQRQQPRSRPTHPFALACSLRSALSLLKVDVEHAEKVAIPALLNRLRSAGRGLPFRQLLMEIHHSDRNKSATVDLLEALEAADLVPFMNEENLVVRRSGVLQRGGSDPIPRAASDARRSHAHSRLHCAPRAPQPCINGETPKVMEYSFLALNFAPLAPP